VSDGWTYGPNRDDVAKRDPRLLPYSDLSESEKKYDRKLAVQTLKAVMRLGYRITRAEE
jgi:hypothetical protein